MGGGTIIRLLLGAAIRKKNERYGKKTENGTGTVAVTNSDPPLYILKKTTVVAQGLKCFS